MGSQMSQTDADQIRRELQDHKRDTDRVIDKLGQNMDKLTEAVTEIRVYQAELNTATQRIASVESDLKTLSEKFSDMNGKMAVADSFVKSANKLMWGVAAAIVMIIIKVVMDMS